MLLNKMDALVEFFSKILSLIMFVVVIVLIIFFAIVYKFTDFQLNLKRKALQYRAQITNENNRNFHESFRRKPENCTKNEINKGEEKLKINNNNNKLKKTAKNENIYEKEAFGQEQINSLEDNFSKADDTKLIIKNNCSENCNKIMNSSKIKNNNKNHYKNTNNNNNKATMNNTTVERPSFLVSNLFYYNNIWNL